MLIEINFVIYYNIMGHVRKSKVEFAFLENTNSDENLAL